MTSTKWIDVSSNHECVRNTLDGIAMKLLGESAYMDNQQYGDCANKCIKMHFWNDNFVRVQFYHDKDINDYHSIGVNKDESEEKMNETMYIVENFLVKCSASNVIMDNSNEQNRDFDENTYLHNDVYDWDSAMYDVALDKHKKYHFGTRKVYKMLIALGWPIKYKIVQKVVSRCTVCTYFRQVVPHGPLGQPVHSIEPRKVVYVDAIGPLIKGRRGIRFIFSIIDSATRCAESTLCKKMTASNVVRALEKWISIRGQVGMIMSDNASYFHSKIVKRWCIRNNVQQGFCPPYYHEGIGIIERFQRTLEDRIKRLLLDRGGS